MKIFYIAFIAIIIASCGSSPQQNDPIPDHDNFKLESKILGESRTINVWTPPNYKSSTDSLPVLYMQDGGLKEDFPHIANTLAKLIEAKSIRPIMLVGIENTDRKRDLTGASQTSKDEEFCPLTDGAKNFRGFITDELESNINKNHRTTNEKGIIGESLSGLFVYETFIKHPTDFDFYIAFDPALWWINHKLEKETAMDLKNFPDKKSDFGLQVPAQKI